MSLFLDVSNSALGQRWQGRMQPGPSGQAQAMVQLYGIGDVLARIVAGRGINADQIEAFLDPKLRDLMPDPLVLQDMARAAARLVEAVQRHQTVAIFGDYDVDGAASAALLAEYLQACGCPFILHIPDRIFEGYGPNDEAITALHKAGAQLLVSVDCGTTSHAPLRHARSLGMDCIVLDHHQAPETLPDAIIVNPNRQDDLSGLGYLCAAGVVHLTLVALHRALRAQGFWSAARPGPDLMQSLDLVALATVADVAALRDLNRAYVFRGLAVMRRRERIGLRALMDVAKLNGPPRAFHLGFLLGPRINAGGRIGDAALGAKLLMIEDEDEAQRIALELDRLNQERRHIETQTLEQASAEAMASVGATDMGAVIVTQGEGWHPGVVGLVAARLRESFGRPAFAIAFQGRTGTGSGRSIAGVDLGRAVRGAVEAGLLVKGGGHAMAAGITILRDQLGPFRAWLDIQLGQKITEMRENETLMIDAALSAGGAVPGLIEAIERAGPFGAGNPEPIFVFPHHTIVSAGLVGTNHVRAKLQAPDLSTINAIAFRAKDTALGRALLGGQGEVMHVAGQLALDQWGGRTSVQLRIVDCAVPRNE